MAVPIAGANGLDPAMSALGGGTGGAPANGAAPDQIRAKIEQAVSQIRDLSSQLDEVGKSIPGSGPIVNQIKQQLRKLAMTAAQAGSTQNGSADALPS